MNKIFLSAGAFVGTIVLVAIPSMTNPDAPLKGAVVAPEEAKILFVGDMFFDRSIRQYQEERGEDYPFSCIGDLFSRADFIVGNLEGPITAHESMSVGSVVGSPANYTFTFAPSTAMLLSRHKVEVVNLGNNHIENFGLEGIVSTRDYLKDAGIDYFGGVHGDEPVARGQQNGVDLSFVSYNQFGGVSPNDIAQKIAGEHAEGRFVVVVSHWGEEYTDTSDELREIANLFVGAGADLIIGSHQHVILPNEVIGSTPVYYGLGNFIFDQYFEEAVTRGLTVLVTITPTGIANVQEFPVILKPDRTTCLL